MPLLYLRRLTSRKRTESANRHLARYLAFVAGAANAGGFLAVRQYTSHMSRIVASMADNLASYIRINRQQHPSFCMLQQGCFASVHHALERGERQLSNILNSLQGSGSILWRCNVANISRDTYSAPLDFLFSNINTQKELAAAESLVIT